MYEFCVMVVLVRLSVPVQVTDWKDSSPKWPMCWWGHYTLLIHSLTVLLGTPIPQVGLPRLCAGF